MVYSDVKWLPIICDVLWSTPAQVIPPVPRVYSWVDCHCSDYKRLWIPHVWLHAFFIWFISETQRRSTWYLFHWRLSGPQNLSWESNFKSSVIQQPVQLPYWDILAPYVYHITSLNRPVLMVQFYPGPITWSEAYHSPPQFYIASFSHLNTPSTLQHELNALVSILCTSDLQKSVFSLAPNTELKRSVTRSGSFKHTWLEAFTWN